MLEWTVLALALFVVFAGLVALSRLAEIIQEIQLIRQYLEVDTPFRFISLPQRLSNQVEGLRLALEERGVRIKKQDDEDDDVSELLGG